MDLKKELRRQEIRARGAWVPVDETSSLLVGDDRKELRKAWQREEAAMRRHKRIRPNVTLDDDQTLEVFVRSAFGVLIRDWKGFIDEGGKPEPFTVDRLLYWAQNVESFRTVVFGDGKHEGILAGLDYLLTEENVEIVRGNSSPPSGGSSSTGDGSGE